MTEIPVKAIDSFGLLGGLGGLTTLLMAGIFIWYIKTSRKHAAEKDAEAAKERRLREEREAAERLARDQAFAQERKEWREALQAALDRNTAVIGSLEKALTVRPCLRPTHERTREADTRVR